MDMLSYDLLKETSVELEELSGAYTYPTDLDLPIFNHLIPCDQRYD